jgi:hypothetical protein
MMMAPAPDLLRRFVATPHKTRCVIHGRVVSIESNKLDLVECFVPTNQRTSGDLIWICKIVRGTEAPIAPMECETLGHDTLEVKCFRGGSQLVIDRETREVFVFVVPNDSGALIAELVSSAFERLV